MSFGKDLGWRLEAAAFAGMTAFLRLLGVEGASNLGGWLLKTLGPKTGTHKTVTRNIRIAFPDMPAASGQQILRRALAPVDRGESLRKRRLKQQPPPTRRW